MACDVTKSKIVGSPKIAKYTNDLSMWLNRPMEYSRNEKNTIFITFLFVLARLINKNVYSGIKKTKKIKFEGITGKYIDATVQTV